MKSKWSRATNSIPYAVAELDQWYHSKELALTISERPSTPSNPYVPEELLALENCGGVAEWLKTHKYAPNNC